MNRTTLRDIAIPLASLAVLIAVGYLAYGRIVGNRVTPLNTNPLVSDTGRINVNPSDGSSLVPTDLPVPEGAETTESFDLATKDGDLQGTRSYTSQRSVADEASAYDAYLTSSGWTVTDRQEADQYRAILAAREGKQLLASFSARNGATYATVTVTPAPATR